MRLGGWLRRRRWCVSFGEKEGVVDEMREEGMGRKERGGEENWSGVKDGD